jgi:(p)ppGpp synthase/HD superfamily hydrolase
MLKNIAKLDELIEKQSTTQESTNEEICEIITKIEANAIEIELENLHLKEKLLSATEVIKKLMNPLCTTSDGYLNADNFLTCLGDIENFKPSDERILELILGSKNPLKHLSKDR